MRNSNHHHALTLAIEALRARPQWSLQLLTLVYCDHAHKTPVVISITISLHTHTHTHWRMQAFLISFLRKSQNNAALTTFLRVELRKVLESFSEKD